MTHAVLFETLARDRTGRRPPSRRRGFTLLELVVVIGVIMLLAAILTPTLFDILNSARNTTLLATLKEVDSTVESWYHTNRGKYPTGWDSLVTATGSFYSRLPALTAGQPCGNAIKTATLTGEQVTRLKNAGITTVCDMIYNGTQTDGSNATLRASNGASPRTLAAGGTAAFVNVGSVGGAKMSFETTHDYIILGVGAGTDLVGPTGMIKDQPVIIHSQGCTSPAAAYCAPCVIFDLGVAGDIKYPAARYIGSVALSDGLFLYSEEKTSMY
jgi:prepilin-type N-terminal cleavage/methylation domain-containing protein